MQLPARPSTVQPSESSPPRVLKSRNEYRSCHIYLPDSGERIAAILVDGGYYSFFRAEKTDQRAVEICAKLSNRGHQPIITKTPKGCAVWVLEPEAKPAQPNTPQKHSSPYRILVSSDQYKTCFVRVPDLDKQLVAIAFEGRYYSLFKAVEDIQQAVQLIKRLSYRGDETVITKADTNYSLWILEPDAYLEY